MVVLKTGIVSLNGYFLLQDFFPCKIAIYFNPIDEFGLKKGEDTQ